MTTQQLLAENVNVARGKRQLLHNISLQLKGGELVALLGANGAGKSTLMSTLTGEFVGIQVNDEGILWLNGYDLRVANAAELSRQRAVLAQNTQISFKLSVMDVLEMGLYPFTELGPQRQSELIGRAIDFADINALHEKNFLELSGGEKQRVQFARVVTQILAMRDLSDKTLYFFLDEPTASLDPKYQLFLLEKLRELCRENIGILVILHDVNLAAFYCDRLVMLAQGKIISDDEPAKALTQSNLYQLYGIHGQAIDHPFYPTKRLVVWQT